MNKSISILILLLAILNSADYVTTAHGINTGKCFERNPISVYLININLFDEFKIILSFWLLTLAYITRLVSKKYDISLYRKHFNFLKFYIAFVVFIYIFGITNNILITFR